LRPSPPSASSRRGETCDQAQAARVRVGTAGGRLHCKASAPRSQAVCASSEYQT
jgi:hypothetical protein